MIDFRYHVVSLVAVFLALSVGIVLGAGPLREELSTALEDQVAELREERTQLRAELDDTIRRAEAKDDLVAELAAPVVAGRLDGVRVGMVLLPGADRDLAQDVGRYVVRAGGRVVATTQLLPASEDPELAATRFEVAEELARLVDAPEPRGGSEPTLATVLAATLAGRDADGQTDQWLPAEWRMEELELVELDWAEGEQEPEPGTGTQERLPAEALVVVSGGLTLEAATLPEGTERLGLRLDLLAALGEVDQPTVLVSEGTESYAGTNGAPQDPLVAALRAEQGVAAEVSSVDNAESRAGQLVAVLSLAQALRGEVGHWGLGPDAEGIGPVVPPAVTAGEAEQGTGPLAPDSTEVDPVPADVPVETGEIGETGDDRATTTGTP